MTHVLGSKSNGSHNPSPYDPPVDLGQWLFTGKSEYLGEMHPDGTPLLYAPALGTPLSLVYPEHRTLKRHPQPNLQLAWVKPDYHSYTPVQALQAYDNLSNAPYTPDTANAEAGLMKTPLSEDMDFDHQLRILTLERWWEVKNAQRAQGHGYGRGNIGKL
ncbi:MAG: hypothetical protein Q9182_003261 [Xanthomendoza sp. 2 TL-2023]